MVELVVVILIIACLSVAVYAGGSNVVTKSRGSRVESDCHNYSVAAESYNLSFRVELPTPLPYSRQ